MFKDIEKNIAMLKGAYRKLKRYYYYNKNFVMLKKKIAEFEYDHEKMEDTFSKLADVLAHPKKKASRDYIEGLIDRIDFYVLPKKFETEQVKPNVPISNTIHRDKKMVSVNFFINAPIEIHILDTLWTVFLGKMENDKRLLTHDVYGNTINKSAIYPIDDDICFESNILFNRYFDRYTDWRNGAFDALEKNYDRHRSSVLISLDIRSYFYSVKFRFSKLAVYFDGHELLDKIRVLTNCVKKVYSKYYQGISKYRKDLPHKGKNEFPLPIGLFSSMEIGNIYLSEFDKKIIKQKQIIYYGRYVDDILIVADKDIVSEKSNEEIIDEVLVKPGILKIESQDYVVVGRNSLRVQKSKIKIVYIDRGESKALIDIYNKTIRIVPSQMDPLPSAGLELSSLDEVAYSIQNFTKENKIRDIGALDIDAFKVGRFFSALPRRYFNIDAGGESVKQEIPDHIAQIEKLFTGSQCVEFYTNWMNYLYFLVITRRNKQLHDFCAKTKKQIDLLKPNSLDRSIYKRSASINHRLKKTLKEHLETCLHTVLAVDSDLAQKNFRQHWDLVKPYIESNMFDHSFVSLPMANYLDYDKVYVSYSKIDLGKLGIYPEKLEESFKIVWSPRFIHFDELLLLLFYDYHRKNGTGSPSLYTENTLNKLIKKFSAVNHLKYEPIMMTSQRKPLIMEEYSLENISWPNQQWHIPEHVNVAVGSIDITIDKCVKAFHRWKNLKLEDKEMLHKILREAFTCFSSKERGTMLLVLPELYVPIYWIGDLIRFSKRSQIAIVTGLQYLGDETKRKYNYMATILPFSTGKKNYRNVYVHIREKNDYSPIEFDELAKEGFCCQNKDIAEYQVFHWKGINLTPILCYELTDIMARALLKGRSDIIAVPEFNSDTTYFSNIIESSVRDLHTFIVQANASHLGDSRVTGPYDRDSKDIFKIKGGDNEHIVIGTIEFKKLKDFQRHYEERLDARLEEIRQEANKNHPEYPKKEKILPEIKPLSARYRIITRGVPERQEVKDDLNEKKSIERDENQSDS